MPITAILLPITLAAIQAPTPDRMPRRVPTAPSSTAPAADPSQVDRSLPNGRRLPDPIAPSRPGPMATIPRDQLGRNVPKGFYCTVTLTKKTFPGPGADVVTEGLKFAAFPAKDGTVEISGDLPITPGAGWYLDDFYTAWRLVRHPNASGTLDSMSSIRWDYGPEIGKGGNFLASGNSTYIGLKRMGGISYSGTCTGGM